MVHWEGFEPSTARFVAEYSIQLSYQCTNSVSHNIQHRVLCKYGGEGGIRTLDTATNRILP